MKKIGIAVVLFVALFMSSAPVASAQDMYGALAYSYSSGSWGWAVDYYTQYEANNAALGECGYDCEVVLEFWNTCAAFATGYDGAYGWAYAPNSNRAQNMALNYCSQYGPGCQVVNWACTSR